MARCTICRQRFDAIRSDAVICSNRCRQKAFRIRHKPESPKTQWATPQPFFAKLNREFKFDLDACATAENTKCRKFFTRQDDALSREWTGNVWMNPPYGRGIGRWVRKAYEASRNARARVVCLLPASTDTAWWHDYVAKAGEVRFIQGRLKFGNATTAAPFASVVVVFG